jgi:hypothetical protein
MSNLESPQEFLFLYVDHNDPSMETKKASIIGKDVRDAMHLFNTTIAKGDIDIRVTGIYQPLAAELDPWKINVQHLRVEFPPLQDSQQDEEAEALAIFISDYLTNRFFGQKFVPSIVSLGGFYRGDHNWDNVDEPNACVNHPNRGSGENEP